MNVSMPEPPAGWRTVAPADCVGLPVISMGYHREMVEMADEQGLQVRAGSTLTAEYHRVDGEWRPVPGTLKVR